MSGDQRETSQVAQRLGSIPCHGPLETHAHWGSLLPSPSLGALPGQSANEGPKPAHSSRRRGAKSPQLRRGAQGEAAAMAYRFPAPGCRFLGWGNPGAAASWHKVNRGSMDFGKLLSFNFSFSQCIYLLISKREVFWRNDCASSWHPAAAQKKRLRAGGTDCSCWSQELQLLVPIWETVLNAICLLILDSSRVYQISLPDPKALGVAFSGFDCESGCCDSFQANTPWILLPALQHFILVIWGIIYK